jgi:sialidase-1
VLRYSGSAGEGTGGTAIRPCEDHRAGGHARRYAFDMPDPASAPVFSETLPGVSRLIAVATAQFPRFSEADVVELSDGRLLLALARKEGAGDFAAGTIIGFFSSDGGVSWDDQPHVIRERWGDVSDVMSVSFCRTPRGLHLFFLARGPKAVAGHDLRVMQIVSADEGRTWGEPQKVSRRVGYHVVNNARVILTRAGRLMVPVAFTSDIGKAYRKQRLFCLISDDDGVNWRETNEVAGDEGPLMEPGVVECRDGSIYMTIRTSTGFLYEARSKDGGATWGELRRTSLASPEAPSTVARDPKTGDLWLFWIHRDKGAWKQRNPLVVAVSRDDGKTWGTPRAIEYDPGGSFGYVSVTVVKSGVILTYYDWRDHGQKPFEQTSLRQRTIPIGWFRGDVVPPAFRAAREPVIKADEIGRGVSANSGLLVEPGKWRLWYTLETRGRQGVPMRVLVSESSDEGLTWKRGEPVDLGDDASYYHPAVLRVGKEIWLYVWRMAGGGESGLFRYVSRDDGRSFARNPDRPLMAHPKAARAFREKAGEGRQSNDAFMVVRCPDDTFGYFAAYLKNATDPRAVIKHDNAPGVVRLIGHSTSHDGVDFTPLQVVIEPHYDAGDPFDEQFYGMQVFPYRGFFLGLLFTYHVQSQVIQPEWAWSHTGINWTRTRVPAMSLGDEGHFDSRMILFGSVAVTDTQIVWLYSGYNWRHNAFAKRNVTTSIGRATLPRRQLDMWLATLPQP